MVSSKKICSRCGHPIKRGENYTAMIIDEDWNPFMSVEDMFTGSFRWKTYHKNCPNPPKQDKSKPKNHIK